MNRFAKGFRVVSGIVMLLNLVAAFVPVTVCTQENYPTLSWTAFDYIKSIFDRKLPYGEAIANEMTSGQLLWIIGLMLLPILLSVITSIWGIVGSERQIFSCILALVVTGIYGGMIVRIPYLWPVDTGNCVYSRGAACTMHLVIGAVGCVTALVALILTPRKPKTRTASAIPKVNEIKQEQIQARYNVILEEEQDQFPAYTSKQPRGVMVGLKGMYAGAEISLLNGEYIKLGRLADNHLVFEGQEKVSRNHCKIKWDSNTGKYTIVDYSSNGTFVNGSQDCLPQNLEIEMIPGTVIVLGDENNIFRLE